MFSVTIGPTAQGTLVSSAAHVVVGVPYVPDESDRD
jgi:hypothetical protein